MRMCRVLLILAIAGASTIAVQAKGILGQQEAGSSVREQTSEERFLATEAGRELMELVDDILAGKSNEAEIIAYQKKWGIVDPNPMNRFKQGIPPSPWPWPTGTPPLKGN